MKAKWNCETPSGFLYFRRILCLMYSSGLNFQSWKAESGTRYLFHIYSFSPVGWARFHVLHGAWRCFLLSFPLNSVINPASLDHLLSLPFTRTTRSLWRIHVQKSYVSPVTCRLAKILFFSSIPTEEELWSSDESTGQHNVYQRNDTGKYAACGRGQCRSAGVKSYLKSLSVPATQCNADFSITWEYN